MKLFGHLVIHAVLIINILVSIVWTESTAKYVEEGYYRGVIYDIKTVCDNVCDKYYFVRWNTGGETMLTPKELKQPNALVGGIITTQYTRFMLGIMPAGIMPHDSAPPPSWQSTIMFLVFLITIGGYPWYVVRVTVYFINRRKKDKNNEN